MSTRSVIARKTQTGFTGVYHHWDGYPSGLGAMLFELRNGHFKRDTQAMLRYLIDEHPAGWSTIINADFSLPSGPRPDSNLEICQSCGLPAWMHYGQYYEESSKYWVQAGRPARPEPNKILQFDHAPAPDRDEPAGPVCFNDGDNPITERTASGCGCEYAYVFDGNGKMEVQVSYCDPSGPNSGEKMIGMFGCGDERGVWTTVAEVLLDRREPNWKRIESACCSKAAA